MTSFMNIRKIDPSKSNKERFFVDTNVWYWLTYVSSKQFLANPPSDYQTTIYPDFIEKVLQGGSELYYTQLTLVELANIIERAELAIYNAKIGSGEQKISNIKKFRKIKDARTNVLNEIEVAWQSIKNIAKELPVNLHSGILPEFLSTIQSFKLDGYDVLYYQIMKNNNIKNIITDDKDFIHINDIDVYCCYNQ
ncbi:type II toxin-antitoxin system VapC family toxin [Aeromonas caviae]|uniref:type II toxin-antitoxin system VapC family toxin n=1 Tax=Aeromonas caviae TaxID=648 RepID=UPI002B486DE9|nr:PIN domain-containing protein [Aeromonas caviae]